jgi:hypothetical protein
MKAQLTFVLLSIISISALAQDKQTAAADNLDGFQFTAGLGIVATGGRQSINATTIDNGVVRVTEKQNIQNGLWLASHMFTDSCAIKDESNNTCKEFKHSRWGMFVAAQLGGSSSNNEGKLVQSLAFGASYTYMSKLGGNVTSAPLVVSLGLASVPQKKLSTPYQDGQPLPVGSNQPVIVTKNIIAPVLLVSYRFGGI